MIRIMITAPASGSGKTAVTCGLLALLKKTRRTCAFKCGPDYIDPMFHRSVLGIESHNLDLFLAGEDRVRQMFSTYSAGCEAAVCEGVMGYYDGLAGKSAVASAWHLSGILDLPAVLVLRPKGSALSLAALIRGFAQFRMPSRIAGVILNDCSESFYKTYGPILEEESGIPVLGHLPHMEEAAFESRHLGLMTAGEIGDLRQRIDRIAQTMERTIDLQRLFDIAEGEPGELRNEKAGLHGPESDADFYGANSDASLCGAGSDAGTSAGGEHPLIAVARDEAFCFLYEETADRLRQAGARIEYFSPMRDRDLPKGIRGLYLPGGYPELYAGDLERNASMRQAIRTAVDSGLPTIAECGGFLYLGSALEDAEGSMHEMAGALPGEAKNAGRLVRFGYGYIEAARDSMLFRRGERVPVHEFHYWDTTANGTDLQLVKASNGKTWEFGYAQKRLYAGFPHLYPAGENRIAERFVEAACCSC